MDYMALNQSWGGAGNRKPGLESLRFSINRRSSAPGQLESASQSEEVGGRRREGGKCPAGMSAGFRRLLNSESITEGNQRRSV
ncbi:hypothetical protein H8959_019040 [Pygathrix nigripes]